MKGRLKLVGWFLLMIIVVLATVLLTIAFSIIWAIIWVVWGWWFPKEVLKWIENSWPEEIVS